jgi:hypothetical protein
VVHTESIARFALGSLYPLVTTMGKDEKPVGGEY